MTNADQAADAILALINSRPTTPTREEIAAVLGQPPRDVVARGAADNVSDGEPTTWPAIDVSFNDTEENVAVDRLWIRAAFDMMLTKDHEGAREEIRSLLAEEEGGQMVTDMLANWERIAHRLSALSKLIASAHTRAVIATCMVTGGKHPCKFMDLKSLRQ